MKTILLTGATGFLGSNLAHKLVANGHRVLVLKRPSSNLDRLVSILPALSLYDIQGPDLSGPFKQHGEVDAVIHTATCYGRNGETAAEIFEANTVFPLRLLETATYFNSGIFFNTDTFFNSESKFNTGSFNYKYLNYYMLSKKHFYEWGKLYANNKKICFVNIRLEHVFGPGDDSSKFTSQVINSCLANISELKLTPGEQKRDFIYVDNVVDAYEVLLEKVINQSNLFQEYELGSGKAVTIREFVETVHKLTKSTTRLNFGALPYREDEIMNSEANIEKLDCLGWRCKISLIDGISEIISKNYLNP